MAIAFVAAADLGNNGGSTNSLTASYTVGSGSDRLLVVLVAGDNAYSTGGDDITGVTYNGIAMTLAVKHAVLNDGDRYLYEYHLENPASGAHNVVISCTANHYLLAGATDYTGVNVSGQPDATNHKNQTAASPTETVVTVADNTWAVLGSETAGNNATAGTGLTKRTIEGSFQTWVLFDSGGAITPAQTYNMTVNNTASTSTNIVVASFAPTGGAFVNRPGPRMGPALPFGLAIAGAKILERNPIMRRRELFRWVNGESNGKHQDSTVR